MAEKAFKKAKSGETERKGIEKMGNRRRKVYLLLFMLKFVLTRIN